MIFNRQVVQLGEYYHTGVVHPGVKPTEFVDRCGYNILHLVSVTDIGDHVNGVSTIAFDFVTDLFQNLFVASNKNEPGTRTCCPLGGCQADSGTGAGDNLGLPVERLVSMLHNNSPETTGNSLM